MIKIPINRGDFSVTLDNNETLKFDVCFNIIHGTPGENGILQAYWDAIGQKYTGCDFYQSALTFNKKDTLPYFQNMEFLLQKVFI
jgi:D-alanine-D-alanine ligase